MNPAQIILVIFVAVIVISLLLWQLGNVVYWKSRQGFRDELAAIAKEAKGKQ